MYCYPLRNRTREIPHFKTGYMQLRTPRKCSFRPSRGWVSGGSESKQFLVRWTALWLDIFVPLRDISHTVFFSLILWLLSVKGTCSCGGPGPWSTYAILSLTAWICHHWSLRQELKITIFIWQTTFWGGQYGKSCKWYIQHILHIWLHYSVDNPVILQNMI